MRPRCTKSHHSSTPQVCWPSLRRDSSTPSDGHHHSGFTHSGKSSAGIASERGRLPPPPEGSVVRTSLASSAPQALDSFLRRSRRVSGHECAASSTSTNVQERACAETYGRSASQDVDEDLYEEVQLAPLISRSSSFVMRDTSPSIARSQSLERLREMMDSFDNVGKMKRYFERRSESVANAERRQHQCDDRDLHRDRHRRHHYGCHQHQLDDDCSGGVPSASADSSSLSSFSDVYGKGSTRSEQRRRSRGVAGADSPVEERSLKSPYFLGGEDNSPARWDPELEGRFTWNARETSPDEFLQFRPHDPVSSGPKGSKGNRCSTLQDSGPHRDSSPARYSPRRGRSSSRRDERHGCSSKKFDIRSETSLEEPVRLNRTTSMGRKGCLRVTLQRSESEDNIVSAQSLNQKLGSLSEVFLQEHRKFRPLRATSRMKEYLSSTSQDSESDHNARLARRSPRMGQGFTRHTETHGHGAKRSRKLESGSEARASSLERLTSRLKLRDRVNRLATTAFDGKIQTEEADVSWQRPWERYKQKHQQGQQEHQRRKQEERVSRHLSRDTPWMSVASLPRDQHLASRRIGHGQAKDLVLGRRHRDHY
ncbi:uncharacterized protein LOC116954121 [Petromyzon marinus]|uniref:uncharacterized protein LOC116954121 n=1 Tax=Petromyzon marinus TaxID=7757 RepID=UPI003F725E29